MTHNTTPKPLSDEIGRILGAANFGDQSRTSVTVTTDFLRAVLSALKAQPAPAPLAEDEAVIADLEYIAQDKIVPGVPGIYARQMLAASNRLSLRSGQLARARAWIIETLRESGPGSHPGRTPEEAADILLDLKCVKVDRPG